MTNFDDLNLKGKIRRIVDQVTARRYQCALAMANYKRDEGNPQLKKRLDDLNADYYQLCDQLDALIDQIGA